MISKIKQFFKQKHSQKAWQLLINQDRRNFLLVFGLFIIIASAFFAVYKINNKAQAGWWNDTWQYRKSIGISNSGNSRSGFVIQLSVDTSTLISANKMSKTCNDLRFISLNGSELPFYLSNCNSATSNVFVKLDVLSSGATIYMYYGNPSAENKSDGGTTFDITNEPVTAISVAYQNLISGTPTLSTVNLENNVFPLNPAVNMLKYTGTNDATTGNHYAYYKTLQGTTEHYDNYVVKNGDYLTWLENDYTTTSFGCGVEINFTDATVLRTAAKDQDNVTPPVNSTKDDGYWYWRRVNLASYVGKTIDYISVVSEGETPSATWTCYFNNIKVQQYTSTITQGTTGSEEQTVSPIAYYSFDENSGTTVHNQMELNNEFGLAAWWKFDDAASGTSPDPVDTMKYITTPSSAFVNGAAYTSTARIGNAVTFAGDNDYVKMGDVLDMVTNDVSVSFWIKSSTTAVYWIFAKAYASPYWGLRTDSSGKIVAVFYTGSGGEVNATSTTTISDGSWHHVAAVWDRDANVKLYVDGKLEGINSILSAKDTDMSNTNPITLGANCDQYYTCGNYFTGQLDEVKVFHKALTDAQVAAQAKSLNGSMQKMDPTSDWVMGAKQSPQQRALGTALEFDGSDDYVHVDNNTSFEWHSGANPYSVSFWMKPNVNNTDQGVLFYGLPGTSSAGFLLQSNGKILFASSSGLYGDTVIPTSQWTFVTGVYDGSYMYLYINGKSDATPGSNGGGSAIRNTDFYFGAWNTGSIGYFYNGALDEVKFYQKALTPNEVQREFNRGAGTVMGAGPHNGAGTSPIGYWKLDEGSSYSAFDTSGNNNTGILTNMDAKSDWVTGKVGKALDFDGSDDYITVADSSSIGVTSALTVSTWINPNVTIGDDATSRWLEKGDNYFLLESTIDCSDGNSTNPGITFLVKQSNVNKCVKTTQQILPGEWRHVTGTYDGANLKIYIDGILKNTKSLTGAIDDDNLALRIGCDDTATPICLNGRIDHVKIYDYARTTEQIHYDMATGSPIAHFSFDEGAGTTVHNSQEKNGENGLVSWWKFDTASSGTISTAYDEKGLNNGTGTNVVYSTTAKIGNAAYFDGTGDYVTVTDNDSLDLTQISISAWVRIGTATNFATILGKRDSGSATANYGFRTGTTGSIDELEFYWINSSNWQIYTTTNANLATGTWYYLTATYDGSSVKIYKDGVLLTGSCTSGTCNNALQTTNDNFGIGWSGEMGAEYWNGYLDSVKLYNRVLSAAEIIADYNSVHGHMINMNPATDWVEGAKQNLQQRVLGKALDFDGSNDRVQIPYSSKLNFSGRAAFSVSAWINPKINNAYGAIVSQSDGTTNTYVMAMNASGRIEAGRIIAATGSTIIPTNKWTHVVFTYDGTNINIYVNATADTSPEDDLNNAGSSDDLLIGAHNYTSPSVFFNGSIDEVKIYNYALTANEVKTEYNRGAAVVLGAGKSESDTAENNLVAWWKMDEGSGFSMIDSSGNNNTALFKNATNPDTLWGPGKVGKASYFQGTTVYAEANNESNFDFERTDPFSISFWFNPSSSYTYSFPGIFYKQNSSIGYQVWYENVNEYMRFDIQSGSTYRIQVATANGTMRKDTWQHVVATYDGSSNASGTKIYVNGINMPLTIIDNDLGTNSILNNQAPRIGLGSGFDWFKGYLDNLKVYSKELSSAEIAWEYNQGSPIYHWDFNDGQGILATNAQGKSVTADGLVGFWTMDNTGTVVDLSGNGNNLSNATSSATLGTGIKAGALSFPTTNKSQYGCTDANCGADLDYQGNGFTISTWVKATDFNQATWRNIVIKHYYNSSTDNGGYTISTYTDGRPYFLVRNSNGTASTCDAYALSGSIVSTTAWMHIVGVYDNSSCKIYINGVLHETEANPVGIKNVSEDFTIGGNAGGNYMFNGLIDHTKVWQRALSASEVAIEYGYDEKYGYLTSMDAASDWVNGALPAANRPMLGKALDFDGSDDYIDAGNSINLANQSFTLSTWAKRGGSGTIDHIIKLGDTYSTNNLLHFGFRNTNYFTCAFYANDLDSVSTYTDTDWHHWICTYDASTNARKLYRDGVLINSDTASADFQGTGSLYIGRYNTDYYVGQIDEVKIYNYALTANQVKLDYNNSAAVRY